MKIISHWSCSLSLLCDYFLSLSVTLLSICFCLLSKSSVYFSLFLLYLLSDILSMGPLVDLSTILISNQEHLNIFTQVEPSSQDAIMLSHTVPLFCNFSLPSFPLLVEDKKEREENKHSRLVIRHTFTIPCQHIHIM